MTRQEQQRRHISHRHAAKSRPLSNSTQSSCCPLHSHVAPSLLAAVLPRDDRARGVWLCCSQRIPYLVLVSVCFPLALRRQTASDTENFNAQTLLLGSTKHIEHWMQKGRERREHRAPLAVRLPKTSPVFHSFNSSASLIPFLFLFPSRLTLCSLSCL